MRVLACALISLVFVVAPAQSQKPKIQLPAQKTGKTHQVTKGEFMVAFDKLRASCDKVLGIPARSGGKPANYDDPITRDEVTQAFADLFEHFKPSFRVTPRPLKPDEKALSSRNSAPTAATLRKLIKWGFVAPVGPLVVGPGKYLNSDQIGDALGYFYLQVAVLTKKALPKWTPAINPEDGG